MRERDTERQRHAAADATASSADYSSEKAADQRCQPLVDANRGAASSRNDADLQPPLLMDERKMQAPTESADVTGITHSPLYHVDEDFEAVRSHLPRHLHLINDHARRADPRVASRRIGRNELRRRRGVLRHPRVVGSGETELLLRAGDVLLGNADFARRLAHITHAITAGETAPGRTAGPPARIGKAAQSGLDTSFRLQLRGARPECFCLSLGNDLGRRIERGNELRSARTVTWSGTRVVNGSGTFLERLRQRTGSLIARVSLSG